MKIGVILENPIEVGGGFNQALNAIRQIQELTQGKHDLIIFTTLLENLAYLEKFHIQTVYLNAGRMERLDKYEIFYKNLIHKICKHFIKFNLQKTMTRFERFMKSYGVDLLYFTTHSSRPTCLLELNYITTVLDLCHRDFPEFPEVSKFGAFQERENHFRNTLPRAIAVIVASDTLAIDLARKYGVNESRMVSMPFNQSPFLELEDRDKDYFEKVCIKYELEAGYYLYPAQLWPHKNHIRVLEALKIINDRPLTQKKINFVFSGGDGGAGSYLKKMVMYMNLSDQIKFLGFIPPEDMLGLYMGCSAVVMPTYFGPTNIPPLEAWGLGKPLIYSRHLGAGINNAALLVNPDSSIELAEAMLRIDDQNLVDRLIQSGFTQIQNLRRDRKAAEEQLLNILTAFEARKRCWSNYD